MDDLAVGRHRIPAGELEWSFDPAGGPGGQHANRASTRVALRYRLGRSSAFPEELRRQMLERLGGRAQDGVVTVVVDESRSQWRNRQTARKRLAGILEDAMRRPRPRRATRPSRAARERRLAEKRRQSERKRLRRRPDLPEGRHTGQD